MARFIGLLLVGIVTGAMVTATVATEARGADIQHSFFVAGPDFTGIIDEDDKEIWDSGRSGARDGWVLPNGNLLITWGDVVREFTRDKKVVFEYKKSPENRELSTAQRLENGNTLITELGEKPRLLEVNADAQIVLQFPLQPETDNGHMQTRMARKLANGNYLVPHLFAFKVKEYTPTGKVVKEIWSEDLKARNGLPRRLQFRHDVVDIRGARVLPHSGTARRVEEACDEPRPFLVRFGVVQVQSVGLVYVFEMQDERVQ